MEQNEIWKDIEGYEGQYQVSNLGKVRSLKLGKERILRPGIYCGGYLRVSLCKEGKKKDYLVHRLVGQAFIPNQEGFPVINHLDQNPKNNRVDNLEWCTQKHNVNWSDAIERQLRTKIKKGLVDPEMCGLDKKEYNRKWMRERRRRKKTKPSEESLW